MLKIELKEPNFLYLELDGEIDAKEMDIGLDQMIKATADMQNGKLLYRITNFKIPTLGAIGVEFTKLPQLFKMIGKIDRIAVLAEEEWLKNTAQVEGWFLPNTEIGAFDLEEYDLAMTFLNTQET